MRYNEGGYLTLSFIPTLGTMLLGLIAGRWFHESGAEDSAAEVCDCSGGVDGGGTAAALHGDLSDCEAHLDSGMDAVERRRVLLVSGGLLVGDRCAEASGRLRFRWWSSA